MSIKKVWKYARLYRRSSRARAYASRHALRGMEFDRFGRRMGWRMLRQGKRLGLAYVLSPVSLVRYWEFSFVWSCLPERCERAMDVSSPRLFALYFASMRPEADVRMANPDARDYAVTAECARALGVPNLRVENTDARVLRSMPGAFDCVWSISVIEHIAGAYDDRDAARWMHDSLRPGGRLILTTTAAPTFKDEYRPQDPYGLQQHSGEQKECFFARWYDPEAIRERLLAPIGRPASVLRWYGETAPGHFDDYLRRWSEQGLECTVDDPQIAVDHYREYDRPEDMPGIGVCGIAIDKPA